MTTIHLTDSHYKLLVQTIRYAQDRAVSPDRIAALDELERLLYTSHSRNTFCTYLQHTLIPDLRDSGRDATADDFETAVQFILDPTRP